MNVLTTNLFVYGSLKRGFSNQQWLAGQVFLCEAHTRPVYRMFDYGGFPALVLADRIGQTGRSISGEIWRVDIETLTRLDILEGVDQGLYRRAVIELQGTGPSPDERTAAGYLYERSVSGLPDVGTRWTLSMENP